MTGARLLPAGFLAWSAGFVGLYALHALGCAFAWPHATLRAALVLTWLAALAGTAAIAWATLRRTPRPLAATAANLAAAAAMLLTGAPTTLLTLCR
jgi:hypothetical protein